jgi:hypothetical protein
MHFGDAADRSRAIFADLDLHLLLLFGLTGKRR